MKIKLYFFLFSVMLLFVNNTCYSQSIYSYIGAAQNINNISSYDARQGAQIPVIPNDQPNTNLIQFGDYGPNVPIRIYDYSILIVRFYDQDNDRLLTVGQVNPSISLKVENTIIPVPINQITNLMTDVNIDVSSLLTNTNVNPGDIIELVIKVSNPSFNLLLPEFKGVYTSRIRNYQALNSDTKGFWFPAFQFSSNLKQTDNGVPFATLPIGIAYGKKWQTNTNMYFGLSGMLNWLIYTQPEGQSIDQTVATSNSFNVQNIGYGAMFDLNDVITLGYIYGNNLRQGQSNPGHMLVLGFGSRFFNYFKKDKE